MLRKWAGWAEPWPEESFRFFLGNPEEAQRELHWLGGRQGRRHPAGAAASVPTGRVGSQPDKQTHHTREVQARCPQERSEHGLCDDVDKGPLRGWLGMCLCPRREETSAPVVPVVGLTGPQ